MKNVKKLDLHGMCQSDALREVEKLIFSNWRQDESTELEIITGRGEIRHQVEKLLKSHKFSWCYFPLNNPGCIRVIE